MTPRIDIPLRRNEDWGRNFAFYDEAGLPIDISGFTFKGQIKSRLDNDAVVAPMVFDLSDLAAGNLGVIVRASEGHPLSTYGSPLQVETLPYDIRLTGPGGFKTDVCQGFVILSRGITLND